MDLNFIDTPVTLILLLVNVLVGGYTLLQDPSLRGRLGFMPTRVREQREYYRIITAGFVHGPWWHLAFNMITLYSFGPLLETILGSANFIVLYFGSDVAANGLTYWYHRYDEGYNAIGASGAISGVLFAFSLFFPFEKILIFGVVPLWAVLFAVLYVVSSIYMMKEPPPGILGRIAHEAHLGGALAGIVLTILLEPRALQVFLSHFGL